MLFSSISFIYYFLPAVLLLYLFTPYKLKNVTLLLASLVFYAWGEPVYVFLMLATVALGYLSALAIEKNRGEKPAKVWFIISITISLGFLAFFKYTDFFIENFSLATGLSVPLLNIALPIGISFYTFQLIGYTIDVYRGDVAAEKNPIALATYISFFPQLIAGPIVRYRDVAGELHERERSFHGISRGVRRFVIGLAKKVLIANQLGELAEAFRASPDKSVAFFWLYAVAFTLHVYFDFSGYSDMARGLGRMFGFHIPKNFRYPFTSRSISGFWRRWHISLGSWFRDYIYIPLGGNRVGALRQILNLLIVWALTGLWHGAAWNFVVWGLYFGVFLIGEKLLWGEKLREIPVVSNIYVIVITLVSFVIFNAASLSEMVSYVGAMFGAGGYPAVSAEFLYYLRSYAVILIIAIIGSTPGPKLFFRENKFGIILKTIFEPVFLVVLLVLVTAYLVDGSFNPFLYFRF